MASSVGSLGPLAAWIPWGRGRKAMRRGAHINRMNRLSPIKSNLEAAVVRLKKIIGIIVGARHCLAREEKFPIKLLTFMIATFLSFLVMSVILPPTAVHGFNQGLSEFIFSIAWSPDGTQLAYGGDSGSVEIVDVPQLTQLGDVISVAWSPDGTKIAGGGTNGLLRIWNTTGQTVLTMTGLSGDVYSVAWSPDSTKIVSGHEDGNARVWDANTGQLLSTLTGHNQAVVSVDWSPDGAHIVTGSFYDTNDLRVWDATTYQVIAARETGTIFEVSWSPNSTKVMTALENGFVVIYDIDLGNPLGFAEINSAALTARWSPDGSQIAIGDYDGQIHIWNTSTYDPINTLSGHTDRVEAIAYRPDGSVLASASHDGTIRIWDITSNQTVVTYSKPAIFTTSIAWSPDGTQLAYGGENGTVEIVDVPQATQLGDVISVAWSPDGTKIVGGGTDGLLRVWDSSGQVLLDVPGLSGRVRTVDWNPDSTKIVSGSDDGIVRLWDATTGTSIATLVGHGDVIQSVDWSPDGTKIVSTSFDDQYNLRIWDTSTYQLIAQQSSGTLSDGRWNPDGSQIVVAIITGYLGVVQDVDLGNPTSPSEVSDGYLCADWSPDGSKLAGGGTGQVYIYDAATYDLISILRGHTDIVDAVSFSPNSQYLASSSLDGTVQVWDIATGQSVATYTKSPIFTTSIAWSPDGTQLAYGGENGTVEIVDMPLHD